jgi:protein-disulfide isomerase
MENKQSITISVIVVAAVVLGFAFGTKFKEPLGEGIVNKQNETLALQKTILAKLEGQGVQGGTQFAALQERVNQLEQKIAALETQLKNAQQAQAPQGPPPEDFNKAYDLSVGDGSTVIGKKEAPLMITVFTDFQCPFCSRFHDPMREILKTYPDTVALDVKLFPLPFHQNARTAAKAALAAGVQGKFGEMVDLLYANQTQLGEDKYKELAQQLGLNVDKFMSDYKNRDADWETKIRADMKLGEDSDVRGTPTFYLNGKKSRARDVDSWKQEIDQVLTAKGLKK